MIPQRLKTAVVILVMLFAAGCASSAANRTEELLATDYRQLADTELLTYYYQISDQIARVERTGGDTRVGVGVGSYPVHIGMSTGIDRPTVAEELRQRRSEVRLELNRRGLQP